MTLSTTISPKFREVDGGANSRRYTLFRGDTFWIAGVYPRSHVTRPIAWAAFRSEAEALDWLTAQQATSASP